ncbi:uncharacterized protein [Ptychodera flava]|uniref:uncharacterized protein isoform X2 n=1 Tax=Ptychodera flava TaxID=63121 RepID=UPI003969FC5E
MLRLRIRTLLFILILSVIAKHSHSYVCQTVEAIAEDGGAIMAPNFPDPYPDGPYNCTYVITSNNGSGVLLELTDVLPQYQLNLRRSCGQTIFIYERRGNGVDTQINSVYSSFHEMYHASTTDTMVIRYEVQCPNLFQLSGFKAKYSAISIYEATNLGEYHTGSVVFETYPVDINIGGYEEYGGGINKTYKTVRVIKAAPDHIVAFAFGHFRNTTGDIILEVRDGMTSESPLLELWTDPMEAKTVFSSSNYLYFVVTMKGYNIPKSYVSALPSTGPCPVGYYKCATTDYCVGISSVCDGYNHCDDYSDEVYPSLNCINPDTCGQHPFPCVNGTCVGDDYYPRCACQSGYRGFRCEYKIEGCPACLNGGTCKDYWCYCPYAYRGYTCEIERECDPPCQNGGTCDLSSSYNLCHCPPGFYGRSCENEESNRDKSDENSKGKNIKVFLSIFLPILGVFIIGSVLVLCLARKQSKSRGSLNIPSMSNTGDGTNIPDGNDVSVTFNTQGSGTLDVPLTPPPTYESVVTPSDNPSSNLGDESSVTRNTAKQGGTESESKEGRESL